MFVVVLLVFFLMLLVMIFIVFMYFVNCLCCIGGFDLLFECVVFFIFVLKLGFEYDIVVKFICFCCVLFWMVLSKGKFKVVLKVWGKDIDVLSVEEV